MHPIIPWIITKIIIRNPNIFLATSGTFLIKTKSRFRVYIIRRIRETVNIPFLEL